MSWNLHVGCVIHKKRMGGTSNPIFCIIPGLSLCKKSYIIPNMHSFPEEMEGSGPSSS